ncbi:prolyl oligopeptidase family serine peptidase [Chryseobacterium zhengzhouense]|uniref:Prolyl oligopeptidase family serine peptidase n=1 Tax=Chryseobacterium zhengzhouense TaxID=1636086 RepID=A0ABW2M2C9_9FLAO
MYKKFTSLLLFLFLINLSGFLKAQIHTFDQIKIDSTIFTQTRNAINKIPTDQFKKFVYKNSSKELPYRLLFPKNYDKNKKYPIIIAFHNSSRIGNDNEKQLEHLTKIWIREEVYNQYNAFVLAPQFNQRSSIYSENPEGILTSKPSDYAHQILELLNEIEKNYTIDKYRIYLIGYSMGASTAQNLMNLRPEKFAAIVSVAAVPDFSNLKAWKNKNIFLIHGQKDTSNPYQGSEELFTKMKNNKKLIFKTFTELTHDNITIPLLLSDEIPKWLFQQHK